MHTADTRQSGKGPALWLVGVSLLIAAVLFLPTPFAPPPPPVLSQGTTHLKPPHPLRDFALRDHNGRAFTLTQLRGHWTFLFFGYTHCPDICPTTMTTLNAAARAIAALPEPPPTPQYVFVSIDPARDTPEQLAKFVPYFNPAFLGVTGDPAAVDALTKQLNILYLKVDSTGPDNYRMDHSASILLIDPQGRFHALMSPPFNPHAIAQDFQQLNHYYEATQ